VTDSGDHGGNGHTIGSWLADSARTFPNRIAVDDRGVQTTYAALARRVDRLVGRLTDAGYRPGDRVATLTGNSVDHVVAMFACARLGLALVPISWRLAAAEVADQLTVADPHLVVVEDEYATLAQRALGLLPEPPPSAAFAGLESYVPPRSHRTPPGAQREVTDTDPLLILFTSGSSGRPKAAVLTHATCFWTNLSLSRTVPLTRDDVVLAVMPQHHAGGWNVQPLLAWWVGATVVLERTFDPRRILELIRTRGVTTMMGVPTHYHLLASHRGFASADLSSLRNAVVGGAPATAPLLRTWHSRGVRLTQGYGLTEAGPNVLCLMPEEAFNHVGSAGRPYHHVEVALADPVTGAVIDGAGTGELLVRGPGLFGGYFNDPEATQRAISDGWLKTGDLVTRDDLGYHTVVERIDDIFITGGENVSPTEVEKVLLRHPEVEAAAVVGVPDDRWGEVGCAFVVRRPGSVVDADELRAHCREELASFKVPVRVELVSELPYGSSDKLSRRSLRDRAARLADAATVRTEGS